MSFCSLKSGKSIEDDDEFIIDDDDYHEGFRTNSSSSIKWSVDARKQNQEDWLSIERILYGEEDMPQDEKTSEELLCWMKAFPHIRVVGKRLELPPRKNPIEYVDEIIAIDPAPRYEGESFKLLDQQLNEKLSLRKSRREPSAKNQMKHDNLEKLLRITSSGILRNQPHQHQKINVTGNKKSIDRTSTYTIKQNSIVPSISNAKKLSQIQERDTKEEKLSYSASNSARIIGPLLNVKFLYKKPDVFDNVKSIKSASSKLPIYEIMSLEQNLPKGEHSSKSASIYSKNPNLIQLPPFNYELDFPIIQGRSIQSAIGKTSARNLKH